MGPMKSYETISRKRKQRNVRHGKDLKEPQPHMQIAFFSIFYTFKCLDQNLFPGNPS